MEWRIRVQKSRKLVSSDTVQEEVYGLSGGVTCNVHQQNINQGRLSIKPTSKAQSCTQITLHLPVLELAHKNYMEVCTR